MEPMQQERVADRSILIALLTLMREDRLIRHEEMARLRDLAAGMARTLSKGAPPAQADAACREIDATIRRIEASAMQRRVEAGTDDPLYRGQPFRELPSIR